ncbi:hypothetical protein [uncultured Dokdonia sp.]|uniref:hypothetical protein n=1 Tax=uncultured Dokdonia sp. TaxID=575653 RepID=UPI00261BDD1F|nr:hypothetical protein [uncultured Dokdonia sp.]
MPNSIDGVPFLFDDASDNQLFGQLFPDGLAPPDIQGSFSATANPNPYQSPFGEDSLFHSFLDIEETFSVNETSEGYTYKFIPLVSGVEVFERYNSQSAEDTPSSKQLFIYYEQGDDTSLDFFGTACRVKFGTERKLLMQKLDNRKTVIRLGDREVHTLSEWSSVVAKRLKIEKNVLLDALKLELSGLLNDKTIFKQLLGLNNDLAKWIYAGSSKMEEWKFTAKNYEYGKWRAGTQKEYEPIIPVFFETRGKDFLTTNNRDTNRVKDKGFDNLVNFVNNFDSVLFNPQVITQTIPGIADDAVVLLARAIYQDKLPDNVRRLLTKVKGIINQAKTFINTIKDEINKNTALFNALLCGLINGIISLLQLVVLIIGFIIDNFAPLELEKPFSREETDKNEQRLEFVEDLIETLTERSEKIFNGLVKNLLTANAQFFILVDEIYKKLKNVSRYFIAFIIGAIVFELAFDAIIAFFTGGTSLAVTLANKVSRASTKAVQAGIKVTKQVGKKVATSTTDILRFLRAEFDELLQAIINGQFLDYVRKKFFTFIGQSGKVAVLSFDELIEIAVKANIKSLYGVANLRRIIKQAQRLNLDIDDFAGFIKVGNIKRISSTELMQQMHNYVNIVLKRGYPFKFRSLNQFKRFSDDLISGLRNAKIPVDDVRIQGSSLRKGPPKVPKDIDLVAFVDKRIFNGYLKNAFNGRVKLNDEIVDIINLSDDALLKLADDIFTNSGTNAVSKTFAKAIKSGKISALTRRPRVISQEHRDLITQLNKKYPNLNIEDISVQLRGGKLELKPDLKIK